jgi:hypothetical protein
MNTNAILILALPALCGFAFIILLIVLTSQSMLERGRKDQAWSEFAATIKGEYSVHTGGYPDRVTAKINEWQFILDTTLTTEARTLITCTRMRAFYAVAKPIEIAMYSSDAVPIIPVSPDLHELPTELHGAGLRMFTSDVTGAEEFISDRSVIQCAALIAELDLVIRKRRDWRNSGISSSIYEVQLLTRGVANNAAQLTQMHELLRICLSRLYVIGSAKRSFAD